MSEEPSIVCPQCERRSFNPNDIRERYCGFCHQWHALMPEEPNPADGLYRLDSAHIAVLKVALKFAMAHADRTGRQAYVDVFRAMATKLERGPDIRDGQAALGTRIQRSN